MSAQRYDGTSWVGVVPFRMSGAMRRPLPDLPAISDFREPIVRLYVEADGKLGDGFLPPHLLYAARVVVVVWDVENG